VSKRGLLLASVGFAVLVIVPFVLLSLREYGTSQKYETGARTVRFTGEDWGAPNPFLFYPRGPGYVNMSYVFDSLTWKDEKGVMGLLAERWETSRDMTVYTFTLRKNARWHDGRPVGAGDVAFTFDYWPMLTRLSS
jgi:ABC-type transport system substrate-binding protein